MLRGHNVRDDLGWKALFAAQGASASQVAAAKRPLGVAGETNSAVSAFTLVTRRMVQDCKKCPATDCSTIGTRLPRYRRPPNWDKD